MKTSKKLDFVVFILLLGAAALTWRYFNLKPLIGGLLYTLVPSGYLILREKKNFYKIFLALLLFGLLVGFIFDFVEVFNNAWIVSLVLPWKVLGVEPIDNIIGYIVMSLLMLVFYEHFLDNEKDKRISKNSIWGFAALLLTLSALVVIFKINPDLLKIRYAYLVGSSLAVFFTIVLAVYRPKLVYKYLAMAAFFFFVWFVAEITALKAGGWTYLGEYIGWVTVFGLTFPVEEIFFWTMWYAATITAYYEFFLDDLK